jgi:hypothetical protein
LGDVRWADASALAMGIDHPEFGDEAGTASGVRDFLTADLA